MCAYVANTEKECFSYMFFGKIKCTTVVLGSWSAMTKYLVCMWYNVKCLKAAARTSFVSCFGFWAFDSPKARLLFYFLPVFLLFIYLCIYLF